MGTHIVEQAFNVISLEDGYILSGGITCPGSSDAVCSFVQRQRKDGEVLWTHILQDSLGFTLKAFLPQTPIINDTLYIGSTVQKDSGREIRMFAMDLAGNVIHAKDFRTTEHDVFLKDIEPDGPFLWLATKSLYPQGYQVHLMKLDHQFNLLEEAYLGDTDKKKFSIDLCRKRGGSGFLCLYEEESPLGRELVFTRLSSEMEFMWERKLFPTGTRYNNVKVAQPVLGPNYLVAWREDFGIRYDTFPDPTVIYYLDPIGDPIREHVFVHKSAKVHLNLHQTYEGRWFGVGYTDHWYMEDIYPEHDYDAWCFLIDHDGRLLWERLITDTRRRYGGWVNDGEDIFDGFQITGYVLAGVSDGKSLPGSPYINDPDIWLLTLDENGCWNGDCGEYIVIDSDSTTLTSVAEAPAPASARLYPNPSRGLVTLELPARAIHRPYEATVSNLQGQVLSRFRVRGPETTLHLAGFAPGIYLVQVFQDGQVVHTQRLVLQ